MAPPRCVIDPAATTNRANGTYNRHSARGGDDDPRRGNSLPREGLQLCVAPYFADGCRRHAGTVEVHRENATPEAVAGCHRTTLLRYTPLIHSTLYWVRQPRTPPGCDLGDAHRRSPHVATTPRGEIRGYARLPPPAGVAEMSAFGHRLCRWRRGGLCAAPDHSATGVYLWHTLYMYRVIPAQLRKCRAMGRHATLLLSLWRSDLAVVRGSDQRG